MNCHGTNSKSLDMFCSNVELQQFESNISSCITSKNISLENLISRKFFLSTQSLAIFSREYSSKKLLYGSQCSYESRAKNKRDNKTCPNLFKKMQYLADQMKYWVNCFELCRKEKKTSHDLCQYFSQYNYRNNKKIINEFKNRFLDFKHFKDALKKRGFNPLI